MCASIPAVFVIAVHWFDWLRTHFGQHRSTSCAIIALLCLTGLTPLEWLIAEDYHFIFGRTERVKDSLYSFSTLAEDNAQLCDQQFFAILLKKFGKKARLTCFNGKVMVFRPNCFENQCRK